jgi:hypothetical protein
MKKLLTILLATLMLFSVVVSGCKTNDGSTDGFKANSARDEYAGVTVIPADPVEMVEGVHYSKEYEDGSWNFDTYRETNPVYNKNVFYRNDIVVATADPFTFRCEDVTDTENYGTYFNYGTTGMGIFNCYFSKDLVSWQPKSGAYTWHPEAWHNSTCWAPEVSWDKHANPEDYGLEDDNMGTGVYFIFCSSDNWRTYVNGRNRVLDLAVSVSPYGPFYQWQGVELGTEIGGIDYGTEAGYASKTAYADEYYAGTYTGWTGRDGDQVTIDDSWWNGAACMASLSYQWENRALAGEVGPDGEIINEAAAYMMTDEGANWFSCIDPTPYYDYNTMVEKSDGVNTWEEPKKYMFFTREFGMSAYDNLGRPIFAGTCVYAVEFVNNDWAQPDYSTLRRISSTRYTWISQAAADAYVEQASEFDATDYELGWQEVSADGEILNPDGHYEYGYNDVEKHIKADNSINEGAQLYYNERTGLYYLTISIASYTNNTYSVVTLIAYNPMGPYRKLTLAEGGLTLSTNNGISIDGIVTGPGHHTIYECGDELLMIYHKHVDLRVSMYSRGYCVDRIQWVKNRQGLEIMHVNGPTTMIQPKFYGTGQTKYDIISDEATVTSSAQNDNGAHLLNDNIIPVHDKEIQNYCEEYSFSDDKAVITFKFNDYRIVKAIMVYNSKDINSAFVNVSRIEMDAKKDGIEGTVFIKDLSFHEDAGFFENGNAIRPGANATAIFAEIAVKEIRITINNYNDVDLGYSGYVNIPEIYIVGVPNN